MRRLLRSVVILLAGAAAIGAAGAGVQLSLGAHDFDWVTVEQERAHFRWSAEVTNETGRDYSVDVTIDLLDDDDRVVLSDTTTASLDAGESTRVEHESSMPMERAADVVSFRFRLDPRPPEGR